MAGKASIYTIATTGQSESNARTANTIVEFGAGATNPDANSHIRKITKHYIEDLSIHPNPNRHLSEIQDGKLGTIEYIIEGWHEDPDSNAGHTRLDAMMIADKSNASLPFGIFGIRYNEMSQHDFNPDSTKGLILFDYIVDKLDEQGKANFICRLYRNGAV